VQATAVRRSHSSGILYRYVSPLFRFSELSRNWIIHYIRILRQQCQQLIKIC